MSLLSGFEYYDRQTRPVSQEEYHLFGRDWEGYRRLARNEFGPISISTVWLGLDHAWGSELPLIFETMVFGGAHDQEQERYTWEWEALEGHRRWVELIKAEIAAAGSKEGDSANAILV